MQNGDVHPKELGTPSVFSYKNAHVIYLGKASTLSDPQQKYTDFCHQLPTFINHVLPNENLLIAINIHSLWNKEKWFRLIFLTKYSIQQNNLFHIAWKLGYYEHERLGWSQWSYSDLYQLLLQPKFLSILVEMC